MNVNDLISIFKLLERKLLWFFFSEPKATRMLSDDPYRYKLSLEKFYEARGNHSFVIVEFRNDWKDFQYLNIPRCEYTRKCSH